jgi:glycerophosphoryl diester phosphodiesterase
MMKEFEIVAHRGVHDLFPENTLPAFQRAIELGADAVELDIRLTADQVPVVLHSFYLDENTSTTGSIINTTLAELKKVRISDGVSSTDRESSISTLDEVLDSIGGKIGLEIEIKGPEPESAQIVGEVLRRFKSLWPTIEITSFEPMLLSLIQQHCPSVGTDLLFPRSEAWMRLDYITYSAIHRARLAGARAVHLNPTQLSSEVVSEIRRHGIDVHAHGVNDEPSLRLVTELGILRICTDQFQMIRDLRERIA